MGSCANIRVICRISEISDASSTHHLPHASGTFRSPRRPFPVRPAPRSTVSRQASSRPAPSWPFSRVIRPKRARLRCGSGCLTATRFRRTSVRPTNMSRLSRTPFLVGMGGLLDASKLTALAVGSFGMSRRVRSEFHFPTGRKACEFVVHGGGPAATSESEVATPRRQSATRSPVARRLLLSPLFRSIEPVCR